MDRRRRVVAGLLMCSLLGALAWREGLATREQAQLSADLAALSARVRAQSAGATSPGAGSTTASAGVAAATAAARAKAQAILDSGRLTQADAQALARALDGIPREDAFEIRRQLAHAINTRRLVPAEPHFALP